MPGFNGTGPFIKGLMTGRGFGRCRNAPMNAERMTSLVHEGPSQQAVETIPQAPMYGLGRGGIPRGCGRGRGFGGDRG